MKGRNFKLRSGIICLLTVRSCVSFFSSVFSLAELAYRKIGQQKEQCPINKINKKYYYLPRTSFMKFGE